MFTEWPSETLLVWEPIIASGFGTASLQILREFKPLLFSTFDILPGSRWQHWVFAYVSRWQQWMFASELIYVVGVTSGFSLWGL